MKKKCIPLWIVLLIGAETTLSMQAYPQGHNCDFGAVMAKEGNLIADIEREGRIHGR